MYGYTYLCNCHPSEYDQIQKANVYITKREEEEELVKINC